MKILNLTPHTINVADKDGNIILAFAPHGTVARVSSSPGKLRTMFCAGQSIPVAGATHYGPVEGLPEPETDTMYLVSAMVGQHPDVAGVRADVLCPGTGPQDGAIRNDKGHIIAVTRLLSVAD